MAVIAAGQPAPEFSLARHDGGAFTRADLEGRRTVLVFYPFAFSPVCTDQLSVYHELRADFAERGATLYGVSCDATWSQEAFRATPENPAEARPFPEGATIVAPTPRHGGCGK